MDEKLLLERITYNPKIFGGKPIIRGHRLAVEHVLGMLAAGDWPARSRRRGDSRARPSEGRVLVTLDKDFGELAVVRELPHAGILRLVGLSALQQGEVTVRVIQAHGADLSAGAIITAEAGRLRLRLPGAAG